MVGVDGFRWDYLQKFQPPNLTRLAKNGVTAERMIPSFPSLTFPNFYTLATGLRPENHGIVNNSMFDPDFNASFSLKGPSVREDRWWQGEPIWVTAEKHGVRAACMFWPGSESKIAGGRPSEWKKYSDDFPPEARVQTVLDWLARPANTRPRFVTLYFHEADMAAHRFGVDARETVDAVSQVDASIGELLDGVRKLGLESRTDFVVVADHGMTELSPKRVIALDELLEPDSVQVDFLGAVAGLRPLKGNVDELYEKLAAGQNHYRVYRRGEIPERLHYRNHRRIPPIVMIADEGWTITQRSKARLPIRAGHGFDPDLPSMGATFIGYGPDFRRGVVLPPFENIHVYNLVCALLGIEPANNDGDRRLVDSAIFKK